MSGISRHLSASARTAAFLVAALLLSSCSAAGQAERMDGCLDDVLRAGADPTPSPLLPGGSLRDAAEPLLQAVDADPVHFADAFLDGSHSTVCVLYVDSEAEAKARLGSATEGLPIEWVPVRYSAAELGGVRAEVLEIWQRAGIDKINAVSVDARTNRVVVSLAAADGALEEELMARFGDAVVVEVGPPDEGA